MLKKPRRFVSSLLLAGLALGAASGCEQRITDATLRGVESFFFSLLDPANFVDLLGDDTDAAAP